MTSLRGQYIVSPDMEKIKGSLTQKINNLLSFTKGMLLQTSVTVFCETLKNVDILCIHKWISIEFLIESYRFGTTR